MKRFKFFRKLKKGTWYKHQNTYQLPGLYFSYMWCRYGEINRYTKVVEIESY